MRLPWLQIDLDAWDRAKVLAALLGCDRHRAMSLQLDLWKWAVERGEGMPDGLVVGRLPSVQVAGALEWVGKATELSDALVEAGLLDAVEDGFRVRGLDRYESTFARQEADRLRKAEARAKRQAAKSPQEVQKKSAGSPADKTRPAEVQRTSAGSPSEVHRTNESVRRKSENVRSKEAEADVEAETTTTPPAHASEAVGSPALRDRLADAFREARGAEFAWTFDDEQAGKRLLQLAQGNEDEVVRRWRNGLLRARFPTCNSLRDLAKHWNAYATGEVLPESKVSTNRTGKQEVGRSARLEDGAACSHGGCDYMGTHLSDRYGRVCESHFYAEAAGTLSP
jgi:hypothetical protein